MKKFLSVLMLLPMAAFGKTLKTITLLPPSIGYFIPTFTGTVQLTTLCAYDDLSTDNCSAIPLTWGSTDTAHMTVNSSGLVTGTGSVNNESDIYAYDAITKVLGHHAVLIYSTAPALTMRPQNTNGGLNLNGDFYVGVGTTVLISAVNADDLPVGDMCAWTTADATKATVNNIGELTGVAAGTVNITCTVGTQTVTRLITVLAPTLVSHTWYVRADGGTIKDANVPGGQCDGTLNVAYAGSTGGHCAVNNPMYLMTDETSTTVYTGLLQAGDTAVIAPASTPYLTGGKNITTLWQGFDREYIQPPSGTPAQHTKILGANYASCSTDHDHVGNRSAIENFYGGTVFDFRGVQNVDIQCLDVANYADCNQGLIAEVDFPCPVGYAANAIVGSGFTSNLNLKDMRVHGFTTAITGTFGPNLITTNFVSEMNFSVGLNFDDPGGIPGNRTDGFTAYGLTANYSGCTEELPKALTSASRDGAGNLNVSFAAGEETNYISGTNLVLSGMTPSDLNGTFPVSSITFNQQTASITGGSCVEESGDIGNAIFKCTFTTSAPPAFASRAFVQIVGASPSWLNGTYMVWAVSGNSFQINAARLVKGWTTATISSGGTASTASSLTATAAGSSETASTLGTASHVHPAHICFDQAAGSYSDGDAVGPGDDAIGAWKCDQCTFIENLQDAWDMLHTAMTTSTFTNSYSEGNQGATAKFGNTDVGIFDNNIGIGNCAALLAFDPNKPPDFNQMIGLPCRAGDTLPIGERMWSNMTITNNTFDTGHTVFMDDLCVDPEGCNVLTNISKFVMQNNNFIGFYDFNNPGNSGVFNTPALYESTRYAAPLWTWNNNNSYQVRGTYSGSNNTYDVDPQVVLLIPDITTLAGESATLNSNMNLTSSSSLIGAGIHNADVPVTDQVGYPFGNPPSKGALEFQGNPSTSAYFGGSVVIGGSVTF